MIEISCSALMAGITAVWLLCRGVVWLRQRRVYPRREAQLLMMYMCLVVAARFTFFPFARVDGLIQPLRLDPAQLVPRINLAPFVHLMDYILLRSALLNLFGNIALFVPMGIVWPALFSRLNRGWKVLAAGFGLTMTIEVLQLPFFERVSDIDDLILNMAGYALGYGIYRLYSRRKAKSASGDANEVGNG